MHIRIAEDSDLRSLLETHFEAFGPGKGAELVSLVSDLLADPSATPLLSLVAEEDSRILGHVLFSHVMLDSAPDTLRASILAPLAVRPEVWSRGIGGRLVQEGFRLLQEDGVELVFVLGHADYYPRFGFTPANAYGIEPPFPVPPEHADAWMVRELRPHTLGRFHGTIICADTLNNPEHWRE